MYCDSITGENNIQLIFHQNSQLALLLCLFVVTEPDDNTTAKSKSLLPIASQLPDFVQWSAAPRVIVSPSIQLGPIKGADGWLFGPNADRDHNEQQQQQQ